MRTSPDSAPAGPRRIPDRVLALGVAVSIVLLLCSFGWEPGGDRFVEPWSAPAIESVVPSAGTYSRLSVARPGEEPPPAEAIAVEELGFGVAGDKEVDIGWAVSIVSGHDEYAADFDLVVTLTGEGLEEREDLVLRTGDVLAPGARTAAAGSMYVGEARPADLKLTVEVVGLEWFVYDDGPPAEPEPLSARFDSVSTLPGGDRLFAVGFTLASQEPLRPSLIAVFRDGEGAVVGGCDVRSVDTLPPGESTRSVKIRGHCLPVEADLSQTAFLSAW
ncbi:hypothetical protein [Glycomyces sp. NRRL B-16210]|uniref:hypothetical protein n=1 Tax=Glycomyces sp. NRRL B-16210 TaxID=1463821 RepID=UPI0004C24914|nr:hypothetical protein [Glycomyces sp. NRRL B-16210]